MNQWAMYGSILIALILTLRKLYPLIQLLQLPTVLTFCIYGGFLFYISSLIPGILGILSPMVTGVHFIILSILTIVILSSITNRLKYAGDICLFEKWHQGTWNATNILFGLSGLIGLHVVLHYFNSFFRAFILNTQTPLPWDTVSYHLPGFIEFIQQRSLWSLEGPYQGYSFGYELIANFPSAIFHAHWGIIIANSYAILFLLAAIELIVRQIARILHYPFSNYLTILLMAISLWGISFSDTLYNFGKNDTFLSACLLSSFGLFIEMLWINTEFTTFDKHRYYALLIFSTLASGLGLSTKPNSIAYIPLLLLGLILIIRRANFCVGNKFHLDLVSLCIFILGSIAIGGFFDIRNILIWGRLTPPGLTGTWKLSLVFNLTNPALYVPKKGSILFLFALLSLGGTLFLWLKNRSDKQLGLFLLFSFQVIALLAFAITPLSIFHEESLSNAVWHLRLGMPFFIIAYISYAVVMHLMLTRIECRFPKAYRSVLLILIFLGGICIPYLWVQKPPEGLPGYEEVRGRAPTNIYRWIQKMEEPQRIYVAGLRPYGLYGKQWQHHLFYDLHSSVLLSEPYGKKRIATILKQFHPTFILISVDPHWYTDSLEKPLMEWMRKNKQCFSEVYSDETVSGFKVLDDCQEIIEKFAVDQKMEMGG